MTKSQYSADLPHYDNHPESYTDALKSLDKIWNTVLDANDLKLTATSLEELYDSFKLFQSYRDTRKVSIFGSARTSSDHPDYKLAESFASKMTQKGFYIITGAGGGIMAAGNSGAQLNKSFGLNIDLPFEQFANQFIINDPKLVTYRYFFLRKLFFVKESDAIVLCPGGFGTHDEGFESLTLLQNGRCAPRPFILLENPSSSYWDDWLLFVKRQLLEPGYISEEDMNFIQIIDNIDKAVEEIITFYSVYHSIRYAKDQTIIRLNSPLSLEKIDAINSDFSDILKSGTIQQVDISESIDDHSLYPLKPRLIFNFNNKNYGKLTRLIRFINMP